MSKVKKIKVKAFAKINLAIDVLRQREDGYHEVRMVMQQIGLYDEISIEEIPEQEIKIRTDLEYLPENRENLAYRAAESFIQAFGIKRGVQIDISKKIPVSAGLAGGSADAAAVLNGLNDLWDMKAGKQLMVLGGKIGADVPFCISGGCALAEGIGEKLKPVKEVDCFIVLCRPNIRISTGEVYQKLQLHNITERPDIDALVYHLSQNSPIEAFRKNMVNVLETVTMEEYPIIYNIKKKLLECQAEASLMSGSGPAVFGLFRDYYRAKSAYENLKKLYSDTFLVKSIPKKKLLIKQEG